MATETQPGSAARRGSQRRPSPARRLRTYWREIVAELRKVIYPTRTELVTYTIVTLVFVSFMVAATFFLDLGLAKLDLAVFGK